MRKVGLTGGIGSGKSTVAQMLAERGAFVVDADAIAREVVEPGEPALAELVGEFGEEILLPDGCLDRAGLASKVFGDDAARQRMNAIIHPRIIERTAQYFERATGDLVVHDIPLLVELNLAPAYDVVVVVDCPDEIRVRRLVARGLPEDDARKRLATQATREQRLAVADVVLDNSHDLEHLERQVDAAWSTIRGASL